MNEDMKERIRNLKLMTMRPHLMAEQMFVDIESELMFGSAKGFEREFLKQRRDRIKLEIMVDLLPNV